MEKLVDYASATLVTHKGCMDGSGCAILYKVLGGQNVYYTNPGHDSTDRVVKDLLVDQNKQVLAVDVSISMDLAKELFTDRLSSMTLPFLMLDHHKTALPLMDLNIPCVHVCNNSACGCKMLFDTVLEDGQNKEKLIPYKELIELIDDNDRWIKYFKESEDLSLFHNVFGQKKFVERFVKNPSPSFSSEERFLIALEKEKMEEEIFDKKKAVQSNIINHTIKGKTYRVGYLYGVRFASTTGAALYSDPELNLDAVIMVGGNTISMRASKTSSIDLSEIATLNNGGGHAKAAGFPLSYLLGCDLIEFVVDRMRLE
jgi:oligoribonuclease NrnB/cAMP/cGMP phosphodiesterase (DHH superfamily)